MFNNKKIQGGQECPTKHNFASAIMHLRSLLARQIVTCWAMRQDWSSIPNRGKEID